jgi:hypothetical protein
MSVLRLRLTRIDNDRHRFEAIRPDGSVEMRELETRSFLLHDFVHYAVETAADLRNSFYGQLAGGAGYDAMADTGPDTPEGMKTEFVVGVLQGAVKGDVDPETFVRQFKAASANVGREPPEWLTPQVIAIALQRLRQIQGRWRATPFGQAMELEFPL